ncbi:hypothetical protein [Marinobacter zhejiangensis]|uniref:Polysaccharide lyase n=1 Tax=Marinobacter zhejiangensis TaxID=488535 RepID=A0A1I4RNK9_9GAMM|nr:hypothetical protein [Marinobacter zhejiangensis]SFM53570.1 hypothetical protein SAMN04487963_2852 [Marinobacter zhejiangensis]
MRKSFKVSYLAALFLIFSASDALGWTRSVDFNNGVVGQSTQRGGDFDDAGGGTLYSDEVTLDGSLSAKMSIAEGAEGFGSWGGILNFPGNLTAGDKVWVQFYIYIPSNFYIYTPGNGSLKFVRIRTNTSSGENGGYNDFQIIDDNSGVDAVYRYIKEGVWDIGWLYIANANQRNTLLPRDKWLKLELEFSFGTVPVTEGGNSFVRLWLDDKMVWNGENAQTLSNNSDVANALYLFTYWNGRAPKSQSLYVDNIVMTSDTPPNVDSNGYRFIGGGLTGGGTGPGNELSPPDSIRDLTIE